MERARLGADAEPAGILTPARGGTIGLAAAEWASLAAALLHLWAVPNHWRDWAGYGAFFVVVFLAQGAYSLALPRLAERRWFLWSGLIGTIGLLVLWLQTRLSHPLAGPHRIHAEDFGTVDLMSASLEAVVVISLALILNRLIRGRPSAALSEPQSEIRLPRIRGSHAPEPS